MPVMTPGTKEQVSASTSRSNKPAGCRELDINNRTRNDLLCSLRRPGERGFALMPQRPSILQRVMLSPGRIGELARGALILVLSGHTMIT
jgi:hypothetical protein